MNKFPVNKKDSFSIKCASNQEAFKIIKILRKRGFIIDDRWNNEFKNNNTFRYLIYNIEKEDGVQTHTHSGVNANPKVDPSVVLNYKEMKNTIKRDDLIKLKEAFTCVEWQNSIREILIQNPYSMGDEEITIPERFLNLLREEGSDSQKNAVKALGIKFEQEYGNVFKEKINIEQFYKLFPSGNIQILQNATPPDRTDLKDRAFFIPNYCEVNLIKTKKGSTIIEIVKKAIVEN